MNNLNQLSYPIAFGLLLLCAATAVARQDSVERPNIILVMADDQGWGQTGYNGHPILKTPNLDAMSESGLRFNRFYAAAPVCSPTRASVLTGRTSLRTGVDDHGFALRKQEKTIAQALQAAGYATGHFGKWHLNGMSGPGAPIFADDSHHPGKFGFQTWLSVTNFFDRNPIISRNGNFEEFEGDSSEIIVDEAIEFIRTHAEQKQPTFTVIWYGTPHSPFMATPEDTKPFAHLDKDSRDQHGELVAMDRSIGTLRNSLRKLGIADNTVLWFTSDNGGLGHIKPSTVGGLRGHKGSLYEGGVRVPATIEWPKKIKPRQTDFPAVAMDIFPTVAQIVGLPAESQNPVSDGISLTSIFDRSVKSRDKPIPFAYKGNYSVVHNDWKLIYFKANKKQKARHELYHLASDFSEAKNLFASEQTEHKKAKNLMLQLLADSKKSIASSIAGKDYPEGKVLDENPERRRWYTLPQYEPYKEAWRNRPEFSRWLKLPTKK